MSSSYYINEVIFSAGGVLFNQNDNTVFMIYKEATNEWLLPKGRIEQGETIEISASREIFEETGYRNTISSLLSVQVRPDVANSQKNKIIFWFLAFLTDDKRAANTQTREENFTGKWFSKEDAIKSLKWEDDKKLIEKTFSH